MNILKTILSPFNLTSTREIQSEKHTREFADTTGKVGQIGNTNGTIQTVVIKENYIAKLIDNYIGIDSTRPVTIVLPEGYPDGWNIIIKAHMRPPIGNRKITIRCENDILIDGYDSYVIQTSNDSVSMIFKDGNWWIV